MISRIEEDLTVAIRLVGSLRGISGRCRISLKLADATPLVIVLKEVVETLPSLRQPLADPRSNTLVLVNGKEISVLKGLETPVKDGDEVVLVPVLHGG